MTLPFTLPRWVWFAIGAGLLILAFYFLLDAYGDSRYREGKSDEAAAWKAAEAELLKKAANARTEADRNAAVREVQHAAKVEEEREKIDEAVRNGTSPLDVLFGG